MQLYSVKDYAELKGVTERSVRRWIQDEKVKAHKNDKGEWLIEDEGEDLSLTPTEINDMRLLNQQMIGIYLFSALKCPLMKKIGKERVCTRYSTDKGYETVPECKKYHPFNEVVTIGTRAFPKTDTFECGPCTLHRKIKSLEKRMIQMTQARRRQP